MESMMSRKLLSLSVSAMALAGAAQADAPRVATDIAPVHALVARVMDGVGAPDLIIQKGASPHAYNLRPSEAGALQEAEILFWIGPDLTPWMEDAAETLAGGAQIVTLLDLPKTTRLEFREGALFEAHAHDDHDGHDDDDHDHDHDHDDHGHDDHAQDDHGHDDLGHAHGDHDPHAWLSPENARTWLNIIAAELSAADPDNAGAYFANAAAARDEIEALQAEVETTLSPVRGGRFIVFHDAYQYFESAFDFPASGAISISDASDPSPARIAEIRDRVRTEGADCVLAEPQFNPGLVTAVLDGTEARTGVIDPLGADLTPGPDLYGQVIRNMAATLAGCL
jgi:zinc transport system substrate-binding protein